MAHSYSYIPTIIAHRANSLRRIKHFIFDRNVDGIEMDFVKSPLNGNVVLMHVSEDFLTKETIAKEEPMPSRRTAEYSLDIRYFANRVVSWITDTITQKQYEWKPRKYQLENVLKFVDEQLRKANRKMIVLIDLKSKDIDEEMIKVLQRIKVCNASIYISSKYHRELAKIKQCLPQVKVLASFDSEVINAPEYLKSLNMDGASVRAAFVDKDLINDLHRHGLIVAVWTVNDPRMAKHYADLGVDMIITDIPDYIRKALELNNEL